MAWPHYVNLNYTSVIDNAHGSDIATQCGVAEDDEDETDEHGDYDIANMEDLTKEFQPVGDDDTKTARSFGCLDLWQVWERFERVWESC